MRQREIALRSFGAIARANTVPRSLPPFPLASASKVPPPKLPKAFLLLLLLLLLPSPDSGPKVFPSPLLSKLDGKRGRERRGRGGEGGVREEKGSLVC